MSVEGLLEQLTDNPADDHAPAWSPDGNQIAFPAIVLCVPLCILRKVNFRGFSCRRSGPTSQRSRCASQSVIMSNTSARTITGDGSFV